jgi:hypothetical protein
MSEPSEGEIKAAIRKEIGNEPDLRLWNLSQGTVETDGRTRKYGLIKGASDLIGILKPTGRLIALEVKRPIVGKVSAEQKMFIEIVRAFGGFACVVRSPEEARAALMRARAGESG